MTPLLDRRLLLKAGTLGLGALATDAAAAIAGPAGFTHNVASGEPRHNSVLLWTRYVPRGRDNAGLSYEMSRAPDFRVLATSGKAATEAEHDYCVKPIAEGLDPGQWYFFRFIDSEGRTSPIGRTRTLPDGPVPKFTLGIFSCSNLPFGWFNAYAHAASRADIDLMVHLGDYLYEYERGKYPVKEQALGGRSIDPAGEILRLADYRLRYASYRGDPDLQRLHQLFPMVMMWDDHESANDSWRDGAENHDAGKEGPWEERKRAAMRACREWMPISENNRESYQIGDLATLLRPETRLTGRTKPLDLGAALAGRKDVQAALAAFRDGPWQDPSRTLLGKEQERWLAEAFKASTGRGTRWQVLAQQVIMGSIALSPKVVDWVSADASDEVKTRTAIGLAASRAGLPFNFDMWDGYPAARSRLLQSALDANANLLVLSGDSHNAWAFELDHGGQPAGVEFAGHSVTSPGYESYLPKVDPRDIARNIVEHNRQLRWADTSRRGYMTLELTPERALGEWLFLDTIRQRSDRIADRHRMVVMRGANRFG